VKTENLAEMEKPREQSIQWITTHESRVFCPEFGTFRDDWRRLDLQIVLHQSDGMNETPLPTAQ
jgi:hypothetical protein